MFFCVFNKLLSDMTRVTHFVRWLFIFLWP